MLTIALGSRTQQYIVVETTAPRAYDGCGTLTLYQRADGKRWTLVDPQHMTWQTQRYASGLHGSTILDQVPWDQIAQDHLWKKLTADHHHPDDAPLA